MAVIDFPDSPVDGQEHIHPQTGTKYFWNAAKQIWVVNGNNGVVQGGLPIGSIVSYSSLSLPPGYFECAGQSLERAAYPSLFAAIGTTWGEGNNPGVTFGLPDFRGEFLRGWDHGKGTDPGRGFATHQEDEFESHTHNTYEPDYSVGGWEDGGSPRGRAYAASSATGGSETRPKNFAVVYLIKAYDAVLNPGMVDVSVLAQFVANSQSQADFLDNQNGYLQLPDWLGGFIIQWGTVTTAASGSAVVNTPFTFPLEFPNAVYSLVALAELATNDRLGYTNLTVTGATFTTSDVNSGTVQSSTVKYFAIGK